MTALPEIVVDRQSGHLSHHQYLHRQHNEAYVSVTDYGAVGDGVTDDRVAIQAAADAAATSGILLLIPDGTYYLATGVTFNCNVYAHPGAVFTTDQVITAVTIGPGTGNTGWVGK